MTRDRGSSTSEGWGPPLARDGAKRPARDSSRCKNRPRNPAHTARRREREHTTMRKPAALLAGMALSALVLIVLTVSANNSNASFTAQTTNPGNTFGSATLTASNDKSAA